MQTLLEQASIVARSGLWRRLLEALILEGVLQPFPINEAGAHVYGIKGIDDAGKPVCYEFQARQRYSFGMLRLCSSSVIRNDGEERGEAESISQFVEEAIGRILTDNQIRASFVQELKETGYKEQLYQRYRMQQQPLLKDASIAELECRSAEGHPYHPCYRSRIGFDHVHNLAFSPEYEPELQIYWLAVRHEAMQISLREGLDWDSCIAAQLGDVDLLNFQSLLRQYPVHIADYSFMPVHPWQWEHHIKMQYSDDVMKQDIIPLGFSSSLYTPQQSIRTWSSRYRNTASDIKLSLHIINTSSLRDLSLHSVASAPHVSQWLQSIVNQDPYLKREAKLILLHEYAGASYVPAKGEVSVIWRENVRLYLEQGEEAVPFHALTAREFDGEPYIQPWITRHGVEGWFCELVRATIMPIVHLLVAHGIVLESHAQNMILIHRNGVPARVALRDFHEGVEYYLPFVPAEDVELIPDFAGMDSVYAKAQLGDFYEMPALESLQEMMMDALWFMNVSYLIMFLSDQFAWEENALWKILVRELEAYKQNNYHLADRFDALQFYKPVCVIEPLAQQRLYGGVKYSPRELPNPLYIAKKELDIE